MDFSQALSTRKDTWGVRIRFSPFGSGEADYTVRKEATHIDSPLLGPVRIDIGHSTQFPFSICDIDTINHIFQGLIAIGIFLEAYLDNKPLAYVDMGLVERIATKHLRPVFDFIQKETNDGNSE